MAPAEYPPIPKVAADGDFSSCGIMTAQASSKRIARSLATYKRIFALCDISWHMAIQKAQLHLPVIKDFTPHLLEELDGLAIGSDPISGIDTESLLALNCRTEILPPDFLLRAMASGGSTNTDTFPNECTSLAVARPTSPVWLCLLYTSPSPRD